MYYLSLKEQRVMHAALLRSMKPVELTMIVMTKCLKTAGDYRRALKDLPDDAPIEPFLNNVATDVRFFFSGEGAQMNLIVEPNYTCIPAG